MWAVVHTLVLLVALLALLALPCAVAAVICADELLDRVGLGGRPASGGPPGAPGAGHSRPGAGRRHGRRSGTRSRPSSTAAARRSSRSPPTCAGSAGCGSSVATTSPVWHAAVTAGVRRPAAARLPVPRGDRAPRRAGRRRSGDRAGPGGGRAARHGPGARRHPAGPDGVRAGRGVRLFVAVYPPEQVCDDLGGGRRAAGRWPGRGRAASTRAWRRGPTGTSHWRSSGTCRTSGWTT